MVPQNIRKALHEAKFPLWGEPLENGQLSLAQKDRITQILSENDRFWGMPTLTAFENRQVLFLNPNWGTDGEAREIERLIVRYAGQWAILWNPELRHPEYSLIIVRRDGQVYYTHQDGWVYG